MPRISVCLFLCCFLTTTRAQTLVKKLREFSIEGVSRVSLDRLGNFYLVTPSEKIRKYDTDGNFMREFSNPESYSINLLEPWNPLKVFIYAKNRQEIFFLDPNFEILHKNPIDASLAIEPFLAFPSIGDSFWLLDKADLSIKKVDFKTTRVIEEFSLKSMVGPESDITFLREYQNLIFFIDRTSGIAILSIHGKPIHQLKIKAPRYIGFLGQEIYFLENGRITFYDLYTEEQRGLAVDPLAQFVLITDERLILVKNSSIAVWEYKP